MENSIPSVNAFAVRLNIPGQEIKYLSGTGEASFTNAFLSQYCLFDEKKKADAFVESVRKRNHLLPSTCIEVIKIGFLGS